MEEGLSGNPALGDGAQTYVNRDVERRLRALEGAARNGLGRMRYAWATAAADPSAFDAWETGTAGNTWSASDGSSGTGYPQVTCAINTRALVVFGCRITGLANVAACRTWQCEVGVGTDISNPTVAPLSQKRGQSNQAAQLIDFNVSHFFVPQQLTVGSHLFRAWAFWTTATAGVVLPRMTDTFIGVLPLD